MIKPYKLGCIAANDRHTKFNVFDPKGANCGQLTVESADVFNFVRHSWNGDIIWNGYEPRPPRVDEGPATPSDYRKYPEVGE